MSETRSIGIVIFVIGVLMFLFLSMFFGGFIMIIGAIIALMAKNDKKASDMQNPSPWSPPPEKK